MEQIFFWKQPRKVVIPFNELESCRIGDAKLNTKITKFLSEL